MELKLRFPPAARREIRNELRRGMFQTAIFLTIRQMNTAHNLDLRNYRQSYALAQQILHRNFPKFFPQGELFH